MMNNVTDIAPSSNLGTRARRAAARRAAARLVTALARLGRDTRGATMVEYAVLMGLLSAGAITLILATGGNLSKPWTTLAESLPEASDGTVPGDTGATDGPAAPGDDSGGGPGDDGSGDGAGVADGGGSGGDSTPNDGGESGDTGDTGEFDVAAATTGGGGASSGGGGSATTGGGGGTSSAGGTGSTGASSGGGSAATSGSGQSSGSAATSGGGGPNGGSTATAASGPSGSGGANGGGGSAGTGSGGSGGAGGGGSAGSAGLAGGNGASGGGGDSGGGGGGSQGGTGAAMAEADAAPSGAAETETGTMRASLVWQAKNLGTALLADGASGELGAALLTVGGQSAGSSVAVLEDMAQGKHPWLALLFGLTLIAALYAIGQRTKRARFKKRMLAIADHRWD